MNDKAQGLVERLDAQAVVPLDTSGWEEIADQFQVIERHSTFIAGDLLIVSLKSEYAAVEQPANERRVIRRLIQNDINNCAYGRCVVSSYT